MMLLLGATILIVGCYTQESDYYYTASYYQDEGPSRPIMMEWLDMYHSDLSEVVHENDTHHTWTDDIMEVAKKLILPQFCELTSDTCGVHNSYILDCNCVKEFEQVSEKCKDVKCNLARHFLDHGPRILSEFLKTETLREAVDLIHQEVKMILKSDNFCKCSKELFRAFFKCAKFYNGNLLRSVFECETYTLMQMYLRNLDLHSASVVMEKVVGGMCESARKSDRGGMCLDSVFEGLKEVADMIGGTMEDYSKWEEGSEKERQDLEGRCDRMFGPIGAFLHAERSYPLNESNAIDSWVHTFNLTAAFMDNLYCKWPCKKDRDIIYPCCLKRILSDEGLYSHLDKFVSSLVRLPTDYEMEELMTGPTDTLMDILEKRKKFVIPDKLMDVFKRTVNAGHFCSGKRKLKCSN